MSLSNSMPNNIPFLDLITPHVELEQELTDVFHKTLSTAGFIGGPMVEGFEKAFATFCDVSHSVAVSSGTDALRFALSLRCEGRGRCRHRAAHVHCHHRSNIASRRVA